MDPRTVAFAVCAAVAWTAVGYKVVALARRPGNTRLWVLTACIALPATGFTMATPAVYTAVTSVTGVPNLATLLVYGCIVGYSVAALILLLLWQLPAAEALPRARGLLLSYLVVLAVMVALFARLDAGVDRPMDFDETYGPSLTGGVFLLVYVSAFAVGLTSAARYGLRFARRVTRDGHRPWLGRGLRLVAVGSVIALGYCLGKAAFVLIAWWGPWLPALSTAAVACACLGALVITVGFTIPAWGPGLAGGLDTVERARTYLRLYPLWHTLYRAVPEIALDPPRSRAHDLIRLRDLDFALYRRLVEIRDGRLALGPYLAVDDATDDEDPGPAADPHRPVTDPHRPAGDPHRPATDPHRPAGDPARREAARLRTAIVRLRRGDPARLRAGTEHADAYADIDFCLRVSAALRRPGRAAEHADPLPAATGG